MTEKLRTTNFWTATTIIFLIVFLILTTAIIITYQKSFIENDIAKNLRGLLLSVLTGMLIGALFEYSTRSKMHATFLDVLAAHREALEAGITSAKASARDIVYDDDVWKSSELVIGSKYSLSFVYRNIDRIALRCRSHLKTTIVLVDENALSPESIDRKRRAKSVEDFVESLHNHSKGHECKEISFIYNSRDLAYSFVLFDEGVWIKMYLTQKGSVPGPAIFVRRGTMLFEAFRVDIERGGA